MTPSKILSLIFYCTMIIGAQATVQCDTLNATAVCTDALHTGELIHNAAEKTGDDATTCCENRAVCGTVPAPTLAIMCTGGHHTGGVISANVCKSAKCCKMDDVDTCCELAAACDTFGAGGCVADHYTGALIAASNSTFCDGGTCGPADAAKCCEVEPALCSTVIGSHLGELCGGDPYSGSLIAAAGSTKCTGAVCCKMDDKDTCCEPAATCDTSNATTLCGDDQYTGSFIAAADSIFCTGAACNSGDAPTCCEPKAKCADLTIATVCVEPNYMGALIAAAASTNCAGGTCGAADAATCCDPKAKCDTLNTAQVTNLCTGAEYTGALIAAADSTPCTGKLCGLVTSDKSKCCEPTPPAKCDTLDTAAVTSMCTGASYTGVLITDAPSTSCSGLTCVADDAATCCQHKATCDTFNSTAHCTGDSQTSFLIATAATTHCAGPTCAAVDAATCCEPKAKCGSIIALNDICSGADYVGTVIAGAVATDCAGRVCGPIDEATCCQLKDICTSGEISPSICTLSSHKGTFIAAAATTKCAGAICSNSDADTCCQQKAKCVTFDATTGCQADEYTGALIDDTASTYCADTTCDIDDAATCCEPEPAKCDSLTGDALADVCAYPNYKQGELIAAAASTKCVGVTCGSVDANTCCRAELTADDIRRLKELLDTLAMSDTEQKERLTMHYNVLATETL